MFVFYLLSEDSLASAVKQATRKKKWADYQSCWLSKAEHFSFFFNLTNAKRLNDYEVKRV